MIPVPVTSVAAAKTPETNQLTQGMLFPDAAEALPDHTDRGTRDVLAELTLLLGRRRLDDLDRPRLLEDGERRLVVRQIRVDGARPDVHLRRQRFVVPRLEDEIHLEALARTEIPELALHGSDDVQAARPVAQRDERPRVVVDLMAAGVGGNRELHDDAQRRLVAVVAHRHVEDAPVGDGRFEIPLADEIREAARARHRVAVLELLLAGDLDAQIGRVGDGRRARLRDGDVGYRFLTARRGRDRAHAVPLWRMHGVSRGIDLLGVLLGLSLLAASADSPPAQAQESMPPTHGVLSFTFENDGFFATDRYYSAGIRLGWQSTDEAPAPLSAFGRALSPILLPDAPILWGADISQSIYTPRHKTVTDPPRDDRPYAGMLLGTLSISAMTDLSLGTIDFSLGVIGPGSGAGQLQKGVHELIGASSPQGWRHQITNRPAGMLTFERRWQLDTPLGDTGVEVGIVPAVGLSVGNVQTSAAVGLLARIGHGLSMDFGPTRVRPALSGGGFFRAPDRFAGYAFAGVEGRAVAYEATLDGNDNGYWQIDREPLVAEFPVGFEVAYRRARLAVAAVWQSQTFESQSSQPFLFGSVTVSVLF